MSHFPLRQAIASFRDQLEQRQQTRRQERKIRLKETPTPPPHQAANPISQDVHAFFSMVLAQVEYDRNRYHPDKQTPLPQTDTTTLTLSPYARILWDTWQALPPLVMPPPHMAEAEISPPAEPLPTPLPSAHAHCVSVLLSVLSPLLDDTIEHRPPVPTVLLTKLRQAVQSFSENRHKDATTILRNAAHTDPHNPHLLIMMSQIAYYMAATDAPDTLPEARELAQRCMVPTDRITPYTLAHYRYLTLVAERAFSAEKPLEWIQQHGLLAPAQLDTPEGLLAQNGIPLRIWALMASIPADLWKESDFEHLAHLTLHVIGGGAIYTNWFRALLHARHTLSKNPLPGYTELDKLLQTAQALHAETTSALRQLPLPASDLPWLLRVRYLNTLSKVAPIPTFDQALCHIALDAQNYTTEGFPNTELRALLHDYSLIYWQLWAMSITPFPDIRQPYLIPADETQTDGDMLAQCDALLKLLRETERQRIKLHLWDDLKPWMSRWQPDHLLATATGSNKPRSRFSPNLVPYTHFYRQWQNPTIHGYLYSEVIHETARRGGFASLFEVIAAFEGANRLIDDPIHGLVAIQKRALAAANRANPKRFKSVQAEFGLSKGANTMAYLLPLGGGGLLVGIITFSSNWGQAMGLILALLGLAGVVMLNLTRPPSTDLDES